MNYFSNKMNFSLKSLKNLVYLQQILKKKKKLKKCRVKG